mmetsp:Transcript_24196/g.50293  ORF Transcript_24196/g.50293 Transcript_24196/m.50293 type:complete len:94 (+) Transcript_24196:1079-1360(+)
MKEANVANLGPPENGIKNRRPSSTGWMVMERLKKGVARVLKLGQHRQPEWSEPQIYSRDTHVVVPQGYLRGSQRGRHGLFKMFATKKKKGEKE